MKRSIKSFLVAVMSLVMMLGCSVSAFASLGVDSDGSESLYIMDISEMGSFDGNGQTINIYNCTNNKLDIYVNGARKYSLAANGESGSVLSYRTEEYSYVFNYEAGSDRLDLYIGEKGDESSSLGNNSASVTSEAIACRNEAKESGENEAASNYDSIAQESMTTYMQNLSDFETNRLKTDDAYINGKSSCKKALSSDEIAEKYDECHDNLVSNIK